MRLISCYIEQYGAIKERTYHFDGGLVSFCEENGAGKTTLSSFIKAMFYGLEPYRANAKDFCDRQHFYPFAGGSFGGNLTFEWEGHVYKIERFFGEKSDTADTLTVYCDGAVTDRFEGEIGRELFGIDKPSFERTLFIDSEEMECAATTDIGARLNRFLQGVEVDGVDFDKAVSALEKAATDLKKKRGSDDKISRQKEHLSGLEEALRNAERVRAGLETKYAKNAENEARIAELTAAITKAQNENAKRSHFEHYEYLLQLVNQSRAKKREIEGKYPNGIPAEEEIAALRAAKEARDEIRASLERSSFSGADEQALSALNERFSTGVPSEARLLEAERSIVRRGALGAEISAAETHMLPTREKELLNSFVAQPVEDDALALLAEKMEACRVAERKYHEAMLSPNVATEKKLANGAGKYGVFAVIALLVSALGAGLLLVHTGLGIAFAALGIMLLLADGFLYLNHKTSARSAACETERTQRLAMAWRSAEIEVATALGKYGYSAERGVETAYFALCEDVKAYREIIAREKVRREALDAKREEHRLLSDGLNDFFATFELGEDSYINALTRLRTLIGEYKSQSARKKLADRDKSGWLQKDKVLGEEIAAFCEKYRLDSPDVQALLDDLNAHRTLSESIASGDAEALRYREEKALDQKPEGDSVDIAALNVALQELQRANSILLREIDADERMAETVEIRRGECDEARETLNAYVERHRVLRTVIEELTGAEQALKDRYFCPVKDRFLYYAGLVEQATLEHVTVSGNFKLTFERHGKERGEKHLSAGQRAVCALCFRLALIENMYHGQTPFLILDDPFVALDAAHLARVKNVLHTIAEHTQILYFCCHDSRAM